jgi:hypothetical protein
MALLAVEKRMGALSSYALPDGSYDQDKLGLCGVVSNPMFQFTGATDDDKWAGPFPSLLYKSWEAMGGAAAHVSSFPSAVAETSDIDWIFTMGPIAAAATHRVNLHTFTRSTQTFAYVGFVTFTYPDGANYTYKGFKAALDLYTTGTAAVNVDGVTVTGTATAWVGSRIPLGCRIGFGSTNPASIVNWYEIATIGGAETAMTLVAPGTGGAIPDGPYVIEDLRLYWAMTHSTPALGGLMMAKGLRKDLFTNGGGAVGASVNTDGVRGTYFLKDAAVCTNTTACGVGIDTKASWTSQDVYVYDQAAAVGTMFKYNVRAALAALAAGRESGSALVAKTGTIAGLTGTAPLQNGMDNVCTPQHGAGSGVKSLYFTTTSRVYRVIVANVTTGSVSWIGGSMTEPTFQPGGANTFTAAGVTNIVYLPGCDRFLLLNGATAGTGKAYFTAYYEGAVTQLDRIIFSDDFHLEQASMDANMPPHTKGVPVAQMTGCQLNGLVYVQSAGTTDLNGHMSVFSFDADWEGAYLITPRLLTPGCIAFNKAYGLAIRSIGATIAGVFSTGTTAHNFGLPTEPWRIHYRTAAADILNNTGVWQGPLNSLKDLAAVPPTAQIQFKIGFRTCSSSGTCVPARLLAMGVTYYDSVGDGHYQPSATWSDRVNKRFAWRFASPFGGAVPTLYIRIYDAVTLALLNSDNTAAPTGTWEKSVDGGANWVAWTNADRANDITYLRWTPAIMADNFIAQATLNLS